MTTTTTTKAASDGSATTDSTPAKREHSLARLREDECYHLTGLIRNALDEAGWLTNQVHSAVSARYGDWDGGNGTKSLDRDHAITKLTEARDCAQVAIDYLYRAAHALRDQDESEEPF